MPSVMTGIADVLARLQEISAAGVDAAPGAALEMGEATKESITKELTRSSHPYGTPTPAPIGGPPAMISGALAHSATVTPVGTATVEVGATTRYARIHEFGGFSGLNRMTYTPKRPYLAAAWADAREEAVTRAVDYIAESVLGG